MARITKTLRFEVLARDGFKCRYCGVPSSEASLHVDHIIPRAKGGTDASENLAAACPDCNSGKSDRVLIPAKTGFDLSPDKGPGRMAKAIRALAASKASVTVDDDRHWVASSILDIGDQADGQTLVKVFCQTHGRREWIWIDDHIVESVEAWGPDAGWIYGKAKAAI